MIEARAVVLSVEGDHAWVRIETRPGGCGRCDEPGGCRSAKLAYALKAPQDVFRVPDTIGAAPGDRVLIRMEDGAPLQGALASYGLGATLLVAGAALGHGLAAPGHEDAFALLGGVLGLVLAFAANRALHRSRRWRQALTMGLTRDESPCSLPHGSPS